MERILKIVSDGKRTFLELGGKSMGSGVKSVQFSHQGGESVTCKIEIDLANFSFMPDGTFDDACKKFDEKRLPEYLSIGQAD